MNISKSRLHRIVREAVSEAMRKREAAVFKKGDRVTHPEYGKGTVVFARLARRDDEENFEGYPFKIGTEVVNVDWDNSGVSDTVFAAHDLNRRNLV